MTSVIYCYFKESGVFAYEDMGRMEYLMNDMGGDYDFTLTAPPHRDNQWRWDGLQWVEVIKEVAPLEVRQAQVWEAIKQRRYEATVSGVYVASVDKIFHTDSTSVIQYNNIGNMIALGNYEPIQWKVMDNTWITMTKEVFKDLQKAMVQNTNRIYQVAEEHKAKMMESDNPEEYDYSEGWEI